MADRLLGFCVAVLLGAIMLTLAIELLSAIWGWLVLIGGIITALWIGSVIYRRRRDRW